MLWWLVAAHRSLPTWTTDLTGFKTRSCTLRLRPVLPSSHRKTVCCCSARITPQIISAPSATPLPRVFVADSLSVAQLNTTLSFLTKTKNAGPLSQQRRGMLVLFPYKDEESMLVYVTSVRGCILTYYCYMVVTFFLILTYCYYMLMTVQTKGRRVDLAALPDVGSLAVGKLKETNFGVWS